MNNGTKKEDSFGRGTRRKRRSKVVETWGVPTLIAAGAAAKKPKGRGENIQVGGVGGSLTGGEKTTLPWCKRSHRKKDGLSLGPKFTLALSGDESGEVRGGTGRLGQRKHVS